MTDKPGTTSEQEEAGQTKPEQKQPEQAESGQEESQQAESQQAEVEADATGDQTQDQLPDEDPPTAPASTTEVELHDKAAQTPVREPDAESGSIPEAESEPEPDSETEEKASNVAAVSAEKPKSARGLAWVAVLLALLAVGGVGFLYYTLVHLGPMDQLADQQTQAAARVARQQTEIDQALQQVRQDTAKALNEANSAQSQQLQQVTEQVRQNLADALQAAPPSRREWKLAEAEYLMRIANHRVLMEDDAEGALELLLAADQILSELDDFSLHTVRARLADETMALRSVRRDDLQGIYLTLESIKGDLSQLQYAQPVMAAPDPQPTQEPTVAEQLWSGFSQYLRFRTLAGDETVKPLLAPEEERFLALNLRLALQQAQLAVLERQQDVFVTSLDSAAAWIESYMRDDEAARSIVKQLGELVQVDLQRQLPDISGSLNELLETVQMGSDR